MEKSKIAVTNSPEETVALGARVASGLSAGDLVALKGGLGAGKTMFVKGVAKGLGIKEYGYVNSPSFVILKEYRGEKDLYHFDVYRLDEKSFRETLDYEKYFYGGGVTVVEWADKISGELPDEYLEISIAYGEGDSRVFTLRPSGRRFEDLISRIFEKEEA
ncbi:MAG: tRNA (adenosine(37)-N6)-threonylcarbamoyltransferase complex ATPase subunit type 1 TsaE [Candidatus Omnitrophota bacterium]